MSAKSDIGNILLLAEWFSHSRNLALSTVSLRASGRGGYFAQLRDEQMGITLARRDRILNWFSENWPDDELEWPQDVPRPQRPGAQTVPSQNPATKETAHGR